ncbi:MAG: hypothetical protein H6953_12555 [Chromatiaceae bacterium]|nr:hypothetical protein [Chromatiaceae bacterium]
MGGLQCISGGTQALKVRGADISVGRDLLRSQCMEVLVADIEILGRFRG